MKIQPITRKERFLYEIVGWGETAPKNELTTEELFFAKILGRNVTLPDLSNVPRYYLFLAKIAGENVNISPPTYVSPPLEFFLTRAAGMDVETPAPRTREEIFWAAYMGVETEIEGIPPLTFTAKAGTLSNYRIYGNTVNGESVGDKTGNLFNDADVSDKTVVSELSNYQIYHRNNKLMINGKTEGSQTDSEIAILNGANDEMLRYINSHEGVYSFFQLVQDLCKYGFLSKEKLTKDMLPKNTLRHQAEPLKDLFLDCEKTTSTIMPKSELWSIREQHRLNTNPTATVCR